MEGEWFCYRGSLLNGEGLVMLERWLVQRRENIHVTEVASLKEGEWSCYGGGQFNRGRLIMLIWSV